VNQKNAGELSGKIVEVRQKTAVAAESVVYSTPVLAQATMPHSKPKVNEVTMTNGALTVTLQAAPRIGLPYGTTPRLVMVWLISEAVRTGKRRIVLGESLSGFMIAVGVVPKGGRWGSTVRLRDQIKRLFATRVVCIYDSHDQFRISNFHIATDAHLWWTPQQPDQASVFESVVDLDEKFFNEIMQRRFPLDMRVLKALKRSPLGLDLYMWLAHRLSYLKEPVSITWVQLHQQFGADYTDMDNFTRKVKRELGKLKQFWPEFRYETPRGQLVLLPSVLMIPKTKIPPAEISGG
jgi:hypothetical protein